MFFRSQDWNSKHFENMARGGPCSFCGDIMAVIVTVEKFKNLQNKACLPSLRCLLMCVLGHYFGGDFLPFVHWDSEYIRIPCVRLYVHKYTHKYTHTHTHTRARFYHF